MKRKRTAAVAALAALGSVEVLADPSALDATSVTGGVAVVAVQGPTNGCSIIPPTTGGGLIINIVGTAATVAGGTSVLQPAGSIVGFQCGPLSANVKVSVNCAGGGSCTWTGFKF
jgi:hypothetical protein